MTVGSREWNRDPDSEIDGLDQAVAIVSDDEKDEIRARKAGLVQPFGHDKEWPEYRAWVRSVRCVVCQISEGKSREGKIVEPPTYVPELFQVSDPHHVKTRGAGGVDADNLIPLCRYHHDEVGRIGTVAIQVNYNINFESAAKVVFETFLNSFTAANQEMRAYADHRMVLAHLERMGHDAMLLGQYLDYVATKKISSRYIYQIVGGFRSFDAYVSAPVSSGGLGMTPRAAHRVLLMYRAQQAFGSDRANLVEVGIHKTEMIIPMLKKAKSPEERERIIATAKAMTRGDLEEFISKRVGRVSRRQQTLSRLADYLGRRLQLMGIELDPNTAQSMAKEIVSVVFGSNQSANQDQLMEV